MWREKIKSILSWQKGREAKGRAEKKEFPELRGKQDKKELFQKAILQESRKAIQNPGCGGIIYILSTRRKPGNRSTSPVKRKNLSFSELISEHSGTSRFQNRLWNGFEGFWHFFGRKEKE